MLITSPVVSEPGIRRLVELERSCDELLVVVDHPDNATALAAAARSAARRAHRHRSGDPSHRRGVRRGGAGARAAASAGSIGWRIAACRCTAAWSSTSRASPSARRRSADAWRTSSRSSRCCRTTRRAPAIVTGAGTGTHRIDGALGVLTEWQVGSYVFMDRQYAECDLPATAERRSNTRCSSMPAW